MASGYEDEFAKSGGLSDVLNYIKELRMHDSLPPDDKLNNMVPSFHFPEINVPGTYSFTDFEKSYTPRDYNANVHTYEPEVHSNIFTMYIVLVIIGFLMFFSILCVCIACMRRRKQYPSNIPFNDDRNECKFYF